MTFINPLVRMILSTMILLTPVTSRGQTDISIDELYRLALEQKKQLAMQQQQIQALQQLVSKQQQQLNKNNKVSPGKKKKRRVKVSLKNGLKLNNHPLKAGGFVLRTESPDTRRLNDAS